jgi:hypothetical protein
MTDELMHFGVRGMRWGVRKSKTSQFKTARRKEKMKALDLNKMEQQKNAYSSASSAAKQKKWPNCFVNAVRLRTVIQMYGLKEPSLVSKRVLQHML